MISLLLAAAIELTGVTGTDLRARAFFDANNVKVGDPLVLTVDFIGSADFRALHPPLLSRVLTAADWKIDDKSAKTDTFRDARRLIYRVRPMREGLLKFPALEFAYASPTGVRRIVTANEIPVHAKKGTQVVVAEIGEDLEKLPEPPELIREVRDLADDLDFAWRRALAKPTAEAFAAFDFPEARMNEATMALREGNWARALAIYRRLEWTLGQTPEIERGIIAALARKFDSPYAELPVWRVVLRPWLKFPLLPRVGIVVGGFALLALVFGLIGKLIRVFAALAVALCFVQPVFGNTVEETVVTNANGSVTITRLTKDASGNLIGRYQSTVMHSGSSNFTVNFGSSENPFRIEPARPRLPEVPTEGCPEDFSGIIALEVKLLESCDLTRVETNDVVTISYVLQARGYVPEDYQPKDVAYEWSRQSDFFGDVTAVVYKRYFVADGSPRTPSLSISYYEPRSKTFRRAKVDGTDLKYDIIEETK